MNTKEIQSALEIEYVGPKGYLFKDNGHLFYLLTIDEVSRYLTLTGLDREVEFIGADDKRVHHFENYRAAGLAL